MDEKKSENINKTPEKMSRIAWPKSKYGIILAIIISRFSNNTFSSTTPSLFILS